jgi:tetratricopeptide (TPR) repeat protein
MTGDDADAEAALSAFGRLLDHPIARITAQASIGKILGQWYERTGDPARLDEALRSLTSVLQETAPGTAVYAGRTLNLARFLVRGARDRGSRELSEHAVRQLRNALEVTPEADSSHAALTIQLGDALLRAYEAGWEADDAAALDLLEQGMSQLPGGAQRAWVAQRAGDAGLLRAMRLRSYQDLQRALPHLDDVARRDPDPWKKINLAAALSLGAELGQDMGDLARAESILAAVIEELPHGNEARATAMANHGDILRQLADLSGEPETLQRAAEELREAIAWASASDETGTLIRALVNLGIVLTSLARNTDNTADLSAALHYLRSARQHGPGPDAEAIIAARLGSALLLRYQRTAEAADLAVALEELQAAQALVADGAPVPMHLQAELATARALAAVSAGGGQAAVDQLDGTIELLRKLVADVGVRGPNSQPAAHTLARVLLVKHSVASDPQLLEEADRLLGGRLRRATGSGSGPSSAQEALGLGILLTEQYRTAGSPALLDAAIDTLRTGASLPGTPDTAAELLMNLGVALRHRFLRDGQRADLDAAIEAGLPARRPAGGSGRGDRSRPKRGGGRSHARRGPRGTAGQPGQRAARQLRARRRSGGSRRGHRVQSARGGGHAAR